MIRVIRFVHLLSTLSGFVSTFLILSAVLVTTQMVFARYLFKLSTVWQTEYVIFSLAAATFIGAPYVLMKKAHVNVDIITHYLNPKANRVLFLIASGLALIFLFILFYTSIHLVQHAWVRNLKTPTIWSFPLWKVYIFLPLGTGLLILQYFADIYSSLFNLKILKKKKR
jgi:TRAP-type C4-dicarboxylate transport system permease small subunit